ncbi:MAG: response regulator transcription factor, partial [Candidatus Eremiobacteraeota bacterium]|nr:response regulator transcription factor [Candidatus Eremiobacteraeota bacterium]
RLAISENTVKAHVAAILAKLGATTRTEAVTLGVRLGLVML